MLSDRCLSVLSCLSVTFVHCGQTVGRIKMKLGTQVGLGPGHIVLDGDPASPPQKGAQIFGPCLLWSNGLMGEAGTWHGDRPQPRGLCVRWRTSHPSPTRGRSPQIFGPCLLWPNDWMDQDVTWYGGRPRPTRHCVRCGPGYPQETGHTHSHPIFGPCLLWPNGWMDEDAAWYGSKPRRRPHCTRRGSQLPRKGHSTPSPSFQPMSIVVTVDKSQLLLSSCLRMSTRKSSYMRLHRPLCYLFTVSN